MNFKAVHHPAQLFKESNSVISDIRIAFFRKPVIISELCMKFTMFKKETNDKKYHENPYRAVNLNFA